MSARCHSMMLYLDHEFCFCVCVCMRVCMCLCVYACMYVCVYIYIHIYVCMYVCSIYICMYTCMYVVCTRVSTNTGSRSLGQNHGMIDLARDCTFYVGIDCAIVRRCREDLEACCRFVSR